MGFSVGSYAKIWRIENKGSYYQAQMSISKKNRDTGEYEDVWRNNFTRLVGDAAKKAEQLNDGARIRILNCDVTNKYDAQQKKEYTNYTIFDFESADKNTAKPSAGKSSAKSKKPAENNEDDDLPF